MLTKRTNILFDDAQWIKLDKLAKKQNISVGELVRQAVDKTYFTQDLQKQIQNAHETILKVRPKPVKGRIDYKALINYGRKY